MKPALHFSSLRAQELSFGQRRAVYFNILEVIKSTRFKLGQTEHNMLEGIDLIYRTLCAISYNFVPTSGHPGGSISSGRIVGSLLFLNMDYDFSRPDERSADMLVYAAGHKAMGLYAMWALRNELIRVGKARFLPEEREQFRLEDLLGFRRNPTNDTPLFKELNARTLDGHPTPATPFVPIATGASGVGVPAALGLSFAALDTYRDDAPKIHILEGEGGMTPGRVHEALAAGASARLHNAVLHVDWNQASIDSNSVCREGDTPGDYVQWTPVELCYCHDWNVIFVPNGKDFVQVVAAQQLAATIDNKQPTAIVYRTIKGWKYGIEGKASHGAGHKLCSEGYYQACEEFEKTFSVRMPRLKGKETPETIEKTFFDTLLLIRQVLQINQQYALFASNLLLKAQQRLKGRGRTMRPDRPQLSRIYEASSEIKADVTPPELLLKPGDSVTLRAVLGDTLNLLNRESNGAIIGSAADLLNSTSVAKLNQGFDEGYFNAVSNRGSRVVAVGGICEDAMGAFMAGLSSFGEHIGVTSSYGAFIGALEHIAARLHGIGQQNREMVTGEPYNTWIMVSAHTGVKTGEDGPTHADPQVLQLLQENFPKGVLITLTPWDAREIWPLMITGLRARPAILCPFVTRPADTLVDRAELGLPDVTEAIKGVYAIRRADATARQQSGTLVLQGNGVATIFVQEVLPRLDEKGLNLNVYYITSAELFDRLSAEEQESIFPEALTRESMGITDFTLPTLYRWVRSNDGLRRTLHSFRDHHYLGSGQAHKVLQEAGIHADGQLNAILEYARAREQRYKAHNGEAVTVDKPMMETAGQKVWLVCSSCSRKFEPLDYFGTNACPETEFCVECEYRNPAACADCQAYWMMSNPSVAFRCANCLS
ncbi:MAG: hypothetical protein ACE5IY_23030 [bacterium]